MKRIVIDPGHGGYDPGAVGAGGLLEKDVTLSISLKLADILHNQLPYSDISVKLTRETDSVPWTPENDLYDRVKIANDWEADLFISIHANAATNSQAEGTEVWTSVGQTEADIVAENIAIAFKNNFPEMVFRADLSDGDFDKEANFYVLNRAKAPAILIELAFITNLKEEKMLQDEEYQMKAAYTIAEGICNYLNIPLRGEEDMAKLEDWQIQLASEAIDKLSQIHDKEGKPLINQPTEWKNKLSNTKKIMQDLPWLFFVLLSRIADRG